MDTHVVVSATNFKHLTYLIHLMLLFLEGPLPLKINCFSLVFLNGFCSFLFRSVFSHIINGSFVFCSVCLTKIISYIGKIASSDDHQIRRNLASGFEKMLRNYQQGSPG